MSGHDGAATAPDVDGESGEDAGATAECYLCAGVTPDPWHRRAMPEGDTFPMNCSTRVEFDNYKASYLRM